MVASPGLHPHGESPPLTRVSRRERPAHCPRHHGLTRRTAGRQAATTSARAPGDDQRQGTGGSQNGVVVPTTAGTRSGGRCNPASIHGRRDDRGRRRCRKGEGRPRLCPPLPAPDVAPGMTSARPPSIGGPSAGLLPHHPHRSPHSIPPHPYGARCGGGQTPASPHTRRQPVHTGVPHRPSPIANRLRIGKSCCRKLILG